MAKLFEEVFQPGGETVQPPPQLSAVSERRAINMAVPKSVNDGKRVKAYMKIQKDCAIVFYAT